MRELWNRPIVKGLVVVGLIVAGGVGWWLGSPLFQDSEVNEAFPMSVSAEIPEDMTIEEVEAEMVAAADTDAVVPDEAMPNEPTALRTGSFMDADEFHQGSGTATVYRLEDGSHVLRFEGFEVTNGPDLHVLLVPNGDPNSREDLDGYVDLGSLKGNIGNQNYEIPAGIDITEFDSIVIYCQPFHVLFASARLAA